MRVVFMGTPEFAAVSLSRLAADGHTVCGVFTQPDKPKNRGHKLAFSPVKETALSLGLPVFQLASLRTDEAAETLRGLSPDVIVVAAYGKILPETVLRVPPLGCVNVHSSLLPRYRGAAPINWAILRGETETGVSIMYMTKELDAGDVILQKRTPIGDDEDAAALTARLAALGADALSEALTAVADGTAPRTPQDHTQSTYAPLLSRDLSPVNWTRSAHEIHCQIRGLIPWPCAVTELPGGGTVKLYAAAETDESSARAPGTIAAAGKTGIAVVCGDGQILRITELQSQGGRRMAASAWLLGHRIAIEK